MFPFHRVAIAGDRRVPCVYDVKLDRPMSASSYSKAFQTARRKAGVALRFYDSRHTFVTRLAENPTVSIETVKQLAGHVDPRMLSRYAHIRAQARRDAIATLEVGTAVLKSANFKSESPQNPPQSPIDAKAALN